MTHSQRHHCTELKHDPISWQLLRGAYHKDQEHLHLEGFLLSVLAARTHLRIIYVNVLCIKRLDDSLPLL